MEIEPKTILIIIGSIFLIIGLAGKIIIRDHVVELIKNYQRFIALTVGIILLVIGVFNFRVFNGSNNSKELNKWVGKWEISWKYSAYFDNPVIEKRELEFKIQNDSLYGLYESTYNGELVTTKIFNIEVDQNRIIANYLGLFSDRDNKHYEKGTLELMMSRKNNFFIGRYIRSNPNVYKVDGKYRIWIGKKLQ